MKRIKIKVEAEGVLADHIAKRLEGTIGSPRDQKDLAQMVIQEDKKPRITIVDIEDA